MKSCRWWISPLLLFGALQLYAAEDLPRILQSAATENVRRGALGSIIAVETADGRRYRAAAGFVDRERTIPMDPARAFQIGSITKTFTSAGIQLLVRDKKLTLDDRLSRYIKGYTGSPDVTLRQLLTHTSGIADPQKLVDRTTGVGYFTRAHFTIEDFLAMSRVVGSDFDPGKGFEYNSFAFYLLGTILEKVSGLNRKDFLRERILGPLKMRDTYVGQYERWPHARMARGYTSVPGSEKPIETSGPADFSFAGAAGDMISTADDLLTWLDAIVQDGDPVGLSLADFTADAGRWKASITKPSSSMWTAYGRGFMAGSLTGCIVWGHAGGIDGYTTLAFYDPASGARFVMAMTKDGDPESEQSKDAWDSMVLAMQAVFQCAAELSK